MKVLQTIAGLSKKSGGPSTCTYDLLKSINNTVNTVDLLTVDIRDKDDSLMGNGESWIKVVPNDCLSPYCISKNIKKFLEKTKYELYHTNGLWLYCNHLTCSFARKQMKPYVITVHGMLNPLALKRSLWKKWPLLYLFFNKDIRRAACIHATCLQEMQDVRNFGYKGPIAVIPNPADLPLYVDDIARNKEALLKKTPLKRFGFLGRLHPVKKVENLLYAAAKLKSKDNFEILIIGKGDCKYEDFLKTEVDRLALTNVKFLGFVTGQEKFNLLSSLSVLFVPSDFENFGMIVTEALSVCTPVVASLGTPWEDLNKRNCGWWIDQHPDSLAEIMEKILTISDDSLLEMGENGRKLVHEKYDARTIALQMQNLYKWLLHNGTKPDFVYL